MSRKMSKPDLAGRSPPFFLSKALLELTWLDFNPTLVTILEMEVIKNFNPELYGIDSQFGHF